MTVEIPNILYHGDNSNYLPHQVHIFKLLSINTWYTDHPREALEYSFASAIKFGGDPLVAVVSSFTAPYLKGYSKGFCVNAPNQGEARQFDCTWNKEQWNDAILEIYPLEDLEHFVKKYSRDKESDMIRLSQWEELKKRRRK